MARYSFGSFGRLMIGAVFALALVGATPIHAQTTDGDGDGVADAVDQCLDTPYKDLVTATGCSVCPCLATWASHQAYVDCVTYEANQRFLVKLLSRTQKTSLITAAKNSTCGYAPAVTRCCTWRKLVTGSMGTCALKAPSSCSFALLGKWAEDRGSGSCTYNPCTW